MPERRKARYDDVEVAGKKILGLVKDCQKYFQAHEESEDWRR